MASFWLFLSVVLSGLLMTGGFQTGTNTKNVESNTSPANTKDREWKAAGDGGNGSSQLLHQGKQGTVEEHATKSASHPSGVSLQEDLTSSPVKIMTKVVSKRSPENVLPELKNETGSKQLPPGMSVTWPWLIDAASTSPQVPVSTVTLKQEFDTTRPVSRAKESLLKTVTPSWALLDHISTTSSQLLVDDSDFSTASQKHISDSPKPGLNSKIKLLLITATSGSTKTPQHLEEILTTSSETLMDDVEFSTATQKHSLDSARPGLNPKVNLATATSVPTKIQKIQKWLDATAYTSFQTLQDDLDFSTESSRQSLGVTTSGSSAITQGKSPLANDTNPLIGKCLLAILLLALVAAIFIVSSGVLATMLWRQKKAYRLGQANHTEMVCISSLLSAEKEEEEEESRRQPKVKRVKLLGETGSEAEVDNLTLNSFLPEH
ncbi:P-selectin glycoprotein ligand 1 [Python bivittatus]|uniref:P-selectin glycoprotein ligand 1 n=1 Tax=Python bivittatus TaxID=176946 RepID=A0A9F5MXV0_PYTBI|nr:P-selectin glycoprotein ligand 1 [Python bivittatus]XP_025028490.1 P-selectin glycoprotein ligand 1 [Python bivittatus]